MKILLLIYISGLVISFCIFYVANRVYNTIENSKKKIDKKRVALGIIFYPVTWTILGLNEIADRLSR